MDITDDGRVEGPPDRPKSRRAAELALAAWGRPGLGARIAIRSDLPVSKGYGSSTADIGAVLFATAWALGARPAPLDVARLAVRIEPTDSTIFPGLAAFDHRAGRQHTTLGAALPLHLAVIDLGGEVDTVRFHERGRPAAGVAGVEAGAFDAALDLLCRGIETGDASIVGRAATLSARLHQTTLPKPELPALIDVAEAAGGLGVVIAHSGTLAGLLTERGPDHAAELGQRAVARIGGGRAWRVARLIDGGVRPVRLGPLPA